MSKPLEVTMWYAICWVTGAVATILLTYFTVGFTPEVQFFTTEYQVALVVASFIVFPVIGAITIGVVILGIMALGSAY